MDCTQAHCAKYAKPDDVLASVAFVQTVCIEFIAYCMIHSRLCYFGWVLHSLNTIRVFVQFHDMAHYSFFKNMRLNRIFGECIGIYMIFPFSAWRDGHNHHHSTFGLLDIDTSQTILFTKQQYSAFPTMVRVFVRIFRDPAVFFLFTVPFLWVFGTTLTYVYDWKPKSLILKLASYWIMCVYASPAFLISYYFTIVLGGILFHLQHSVNVPYRRREGWIRDIASLHGSTFLEIPWPLQFFTNGIEYHHIHHLNTMVPSYNLSYCHASYSWHDVNCVSLKKALCSLRNVMYDEETSLLIGFDEKN